MTSDSSRHRKAKEMQKKLVFYVIVNFENILEFDD